MISNEDVSKTQAPRGHWFRTMKARQAIREMQKQLAQTQLTVFYRHLFFYSGGSQSFSFKLKKKTTCRTNVHPVLSCKIPIETFMQHQSWSLSIGQIRAVFRPTHRSHPKKRWVFGIGESSLENGPNFKLAALSSKSITPKRWWIWRCNCKVGPLPFITGVITPISRVITPVTHL